jgi:hypothetical protein
MILRFAILRVASPYRAQPRCHRGLVSRSSRIPKTKCHERATPSGGALRRPKLCGCVPRTTGAPPRRGLAGEKRQAARPASASLRSKSDKRNDFGAARSRLETEARGLAPKGTHADFRLRPLRGDASPPLIRKPGSIFAQIIARGAANASCRRNPALAPASSVHIKQERIAMPSNHSDPASENPAGPGEPVSAGTGKESRQTAAKSSLAEQRQHAEAMRHSRPSPAAPLPILRN